MLTSLRLRNFKAWEDTGDVRLAPLTVLFGTNGAGKTSIPQLLLLLKQTAASSDRQRALQLGDARSLLEVGSFEEVVHGRDLTKALEFTLAWSLDQPLDVTDPVSRRSFAGDALRFSARLAADMRARPYTEGFRYTLYQGHKDVLQLGFERVAAGKRPEYELSAHGYGLVPHPERTGPLPGPQRFYGFPDEVVAHYQNAAFATDLALELERALSRLYYLGPLRDSPRRLYLWSGESPEDVGVRGDRAVDAVLAASDRHFSWQGHERPLSLAQLVAARLKTMGLIRDFSIHALGPHRKEYEVLVKTSEKLPPVRLTDVGFGVSQVLPVIVECFYVPRRSVVIIEQPDVHLHPRAQAALADVFVDAIRARENGVARDCQFIVESHSEPFLRRLQRRIAEEHLSHDDVALYFAHSGAAGARLEALELDPYGNVRNWPHGFFGDEMGDLVARAEAQARRQRRKSEP